MKYAEEKKIPYSWETFKVLIKQMTQQRDDRIKFLIKGVQTVPVPADVLSELVWIIGWEEEEIMSHHPGYDLNNKIASLDNALKSYHRCYKDLIATLDAFEEASKDPTLFQRPRVAELKEHETLCRKEIFSLSSAASALVAIARHVNKGISIPGWSNMLKSHFDENQHNFIKELRNNLNHITFLESDWSLKNIGKGQTSHFEFRTKRLLRDGKFNKTAQKYIKSQGEAIDVRNLFSSYHRSVDGFYKWLLPEIENRLPTKVQDYRRCKKEIRANSTRCWYRILFQQIIKPETDLYSHLHKYLTPAELNEVNALPHRSKKQVDRIIEMVDEHGACNDELRNMAYKAFRAK